MKRRVVSSIILGSIVLVSGVFCLFLLSDLTPDNLTNIQGDNFAANITSGINAPDDNSPVPSASVQIVTGCPMTEGDQCNTCHKQADHPTPTEIASGEGECENQRLAREEWLNTIHKTPDDMDWRQIEAANRRALSLERFGRIHNGVRTDHWEEIGSANQAGRTRAAAPSSDGLDLYVGSDQGGVWRGTIDGRFWEPLSDGLGLGSYELLVVPPGAGPDEPETIFTLTPSTVHVSYDNGLTWAVPTGFGDDDIYGAIKIVHDTAHPRTVYFLTRARHWTGGSGFIYANIIYWSTDGGQTFSFRYAFPSIKPCDAWIDRVDGGDLYVSYGGDLYRSTNQASSFEIVGTYPVASVSDIVLAGCEAGAPAFYAAIKTNSVWTLYRSADAGASWVQRYTITDFWETLEASITNETLVFFAGVECWRSTNSGYNFNRINTWGEYYADPEFKLHADFPGMDIYLIDGAEKIYFNTDGGTYVSTDGGATVRNLSLWGLGISQYYSVFTSQTDPYLIVAGAQDQGYQQSMLGNSENYLPFDQLISGDYGHLTSTVRDHNWLYSVYPGFVLLQKNENSPQGLYQIGFPDTDHSWLPFILADPEDHNAYYFCGNGLWYCERGQYGYSYTMTELPHDFGGGHLTAFEISDVDPDYWFAITSQGWLWYSHDAGATWTQTDHGPGPHYFYGTAIVTSPLNRDIAYVGGNGYLGHAVYRTTDSGLTWTGFGDGLPNTTVLGLAIDGDTSIPYLAASAGPYGYDESLGQWVSLLGTEAPLTEYWCIEWVPDLGVIRYGTYGRGIWDYLPVDPQSVAGEDDIPARQFDLALSPNPATNQVTARFQMPAADRASLDLFDLNGRCLATMASGEFAKGDHEVSFDLTRHNLSPGIYFARLHSQHGVAVRKIHLVE